MARQKELLATGQIIPIALHAEMQRSYLEYAMSVIVGRALPDVRDGLKPVHRRILYAMHELGLTPDRPFRKCARVVGDVLGKYHPHGDQAVYDALVRMVQDFSSRYPLLAGHGNFGSVDNDPPAAMRYTETRLAAIADEALLQDISEAIVDFTSNFDNSQQEPVVLSAQLPLLLLNGCTGIAVGMATNVPPHNLGELVEGVIALIDNPELSDEKLWKIIPGPDFPTGGEIIETEGIREAYLTGKGIIPVRGVTSIERLDVGRQRRKERTAIIVTELPYQVAKAAWIEKVAELVNQGRLDGIADIRDESDRSGMRVVIELKRDADPELVLSALYRQSALQSNFGAILLALVDKKPCQLSLRRLLQEFLTFREQTLTRQYANELEQAQNRLHLVEGLSMALNHLDEAIDILRHAPDGTTAKYRLKEQLGISEVQSDAILAMPMRRLTGLERQKLQSEYDELQTRIAQLQTLLRDRTELLKALKKELRSLKRKFGDARRTKILASSTKTVDKKTKQQEDKESRKQADKVDKKETKDKESKKQADKVNKKAESSPPAPSASSAPPASSAFLKLFTPQSPPEDAVLDITYQMKASWHSASSALPQTQQDKTSNDFPIYSEAIQKRESLLILTDTGKAYSVSIQEIPPIESQPISLLSLLPKSGQENANNAVFYDFTPKEIHNIHLLLLTEQGRIKRMPLAELTGLTNRGLAAIKLKEGDRLRYACYATEGQEAAIATSGGRILRLPLIDDRIPTMGRNTHGNTALPLRYGEQLVGCLTLNPDELIVLISQLGYGKRVLLTSLRLAKLGDIGTQAMQFINKNDNLAGMVAAKKGSEIVLVTNRDRYLSIGVDSIALWGKDGTGDSLVKLKGEEVILEVISSRSQR